MSSKICPKCGGRSCIEIEKFNAVGILVATAWKCVSCSNEFGNGYEKKQSKSRKGGNFLKPEKVEAVTKALEDGAGIRGASRKTGVSKNTVTKIAAIVVAHREEGGQGIIKCDCGKPAGHKGWCAPLFKKSPERQKVMKKLHAKKELEPNVYCICGKPLFHKEQCDFGVSYISNGNLKFEDLIKQYGKYLENRRETVQREIDEKMAEWVKVNTRVIAYEEYLARIEGVDKETQKELIDDYISIVIENREEDEEKILTKEG